jgi:hypothetical protein
MEAIDLLHGKVERMTIIETKLVHKLDKAMFGVGKFTTLLKLDSDLNSVIILVNPFFHLGRLNASNAPLRCRCSASASLDLERHRQQQETLGSGTINLFPRVQVQACIIITLLGITLGSRSLWRLWCCWRLWCRLWGLLLAASGWHLLIHFSTSFFFILLLI